MDQIKTGRFISQIRKEKNLTQKDIAEKLSISDKTVSKWETGRGMPELSLMLPLSEILEVTVNELLLGERIEENHYKEKSQEILIELIKEQEESKRKIILSVSIIFLTLLSSITILTTPFLSPGIGGFRTAVLFFIGLVVLIGGLVVAASLDWRAGTYECQHCKTRFVPNFNEYMIAPHTPTTRYLKCPHCEQKSWCAKKLTH